MNKKIVYIFLAIIIVINLIGVFILPDELVMQINLSGDANWTINKFLGLLIFFGLGILGAAISLARKDTDGKNFILMIIILVMNILVFIFNL